jgi:hypothetical protein
MQFNFPVSVSIINRNKSSSIKTLAQTKVAMIELLMQQKLFELTGQGAEPSVRNVKLLGDVYQFGVRCGVAYLQDIFEVNGVLGHWANVPLAQLANAYDQVVSALQTDEFDEAIKKVMQSSLGGRNTARANKAKAAKAALVIAV